MNEPTPPDTPPAQGGEPQGSLLKRLHLGINARFRAYFFAGILITAPIGITFWLSWQIIAWVDGLVRNLLPPVYYPETYLPFSVPGLGLLIVIVVLTLIGALTANITGRLALRIGERILARMPVVRSIYSALKQIFETVLARKSTAFRQVVLIEYPRRGIWVLGFRTGVTEGEVQNLTEERMVNVFIPTTPNPTSGFLLFVPEKDVYVLEMSVEDGIKMVVSGGIVTPPDTRPPEERNIPKIPESSGLSGKTAQPSSGMAVKQG